MTNDFVLSSPDGRHQLALSVGDEVAVGRGAGNQFQIMDPAVSRRHATLVVRPEGIVVNDDGSTAGTRINGQPLSGAGLARAGDLIELGPVRLRVAVASPPVVAPPHPPAPEAGGTGSAGSKGRVGQIVAVVGVGAAVLSAVVALLVYLAARPTAVAQFAAEVDRWCTTYQASYPQPSSARDTENGQWHPSRSRELGEAVVHHDEQFLDTFGDLRPPRDVRDDYDAVADTLAAVLAEDQRWAARLQEMSDREIRTHDFLRVPGTSSRQEALGRDLTAGLSDLSGGGCRGERE